MNELEIYRAALDAWGEEAQTRMLFEEMGELLQAMGKLYRAKTPEDYMDCLENVAEELADVKIMVGQMEVLYQLGDAVQSWQEKKLVRLDERISALEDEQ